MGLMRFEISSTIRIVPQPDGSYQRLLRELVFYRDLETNEIMDEWESPALAHVPSHGCWGRITPWFPWMLMDQAEGHISYLGTMSSRQSLELYPKDTLERVKQRHPNLGEGCTRSKGVIGQQWGLTETIYRRLTSTKRLKKNSSNDMFI
jgi:hypothetical protein